MTVRKLKNATITHVSYVDKGANKKQFFLTKSESEPTFEKDVKVMINKGDEKRLVYGVVYEPNTPDAHNDMMEAEEIEKSAHTFLKEYRNIDKQHDFQEGYGEVVESYVAPQDFQVGEETIAKGSWVLVTKADEDTWESIKKGEITGYSMAGLAEVEEVEKQEEKQMNKFFKLMKEFFTGEVEKSELKDTYNESRKRRNLFDAIWLFEDFVRDEINKETPDANKLQELAIDLGDILYEVANSPNLIKEFKKEYEEREEIKVKKEELQEIIEKAVEPINEKLEKLEKEVEKEEVEKQEEEEKETAELDNEALAKQLSDVVKEALEPINERLEKVEKARGISKSAEDEAEGEQEEESVFKSIFTPYNGQL